MANQVPNFLAAERKAHSILATGLSVSVLLLGGAAKNERAVFLTDGAELPVKAFAAIIPAASALHHGNRFGSPNRSYALTLGQPSGSERRYVPRSGEPIGRLPPPNLELNEPLVPLRGETGQTPAESAVTQLASLVPSQFAPSVFQPGGGAAGAGGAGAGATSSGTAGGATGTGASGTGTGPTGTGTTGTGDGATGTGTTGTGTAATDTGTTGTGTGATDTGTTTGTGATSTGATGTGTGTGATGTTPSSPPMPNSPVGAVPETATWEMLLIGFFAIGSTLRRRAKSSQATSASLLA